MAGETDDLRAEIARLRQEVERLRAGAPGEPADHDAWLRTILAHSPDVISILSPEGRLLFLSRTPSGSSPERALGLDTSDFVPPKDRARWQAALRKALETGEPQRVDVESTGGLYWETRIAPIRAPDGSPALLGIATNVTARRDAEHALRDSAEKLRLALAASQVGLWHWDVATDDVLWDEATTRAFGQRAPARTRDEFVGVVHPDDRARVAAAVSRSLETGVYEDLELRAVGSDGKLRSILIRGDVVRDGEGRPTALRGAVLDLTAQKQLEEQLRQAVKMDAVGQLAGGVAHDFNNLMLVIMASADLAVAAPDKPRQNELLDQIRAASERAAALTRQLLALSQRQPLARGVVDVAEVASDLLRLLRRVVSASVEIELVAGEPLAPVAGDRGHIEQVLMNLCINARDAMPSGGRLTIRTENVVVEGRYLDAHPWASPGRYVLLAVSDTGTGMTPEVQARIFEPFFTTKGPGRGTGLGLSVAYGIVRQHGGILHVESELGRGSTFEVCLPVAEGPASAPRREVEAVAPGGHETILVAEDDEGVRGVVEHILAGAGYRVLVATDGEDAVRAFAAAAEPVELLLLDTVMPRLGGIDALERIRALQPTVRAILTSGYSDAWRTDDPRLAGVDLLPKPYPPQVLLRTVRARLDRDA